MVLPRGICILSCRTRYVGLRNILGSIYRLPASFGVRGTLSRWIWYYARAVIDIPNGRVRDGGNDLLGDINLGMYLGNDPGELVFAEVREMDGTSYPE